MSPFPDAKRFEVVEAGPCMIAVERDLPLDSSCKLEVGDVRSTVDSPNVRFRGDGLMGRAVSRACLLALWYVTLHLSIGVFVPFASVGLLIGAMLPMMLSGAFGRSLARSGLRLHQTAALVWFGCLMCVYGALRPLRNDPRSREGLRVSAVHSILAVVLDSWIFRAPVFAFRSASMVSGRFEGLAALFGLEVRAVPLSCRRGYLVDCGGVKSIYVSDVLADLERGEVILHELAHFLLRHVLAAPLDLVMRSGVPPELKRAQQEREADLLASGVIAERMFGEATASLAPVRGSGCRTV